MRAIDADALEKEGWSLHRTIRVDKHTEEYQTKPLKRVPTIEAEQIVRCKDCKHYHEYADIPYCDRIDYGYGYEPNDFCSRAERRTDDTY